MEDVFGNRVNLTAEPLLTVIVSDSRRVALKLTVSMFELICAAAESVTTRPRAQQPMNRASRCSIMSVNRESCPAAWNWQIRLPASHRLTCYLALSSIVIIMLGRDAFLQNPSGVSRILIESKTCPAWAPRGWHDSAWTPWLLFGCHASVARAACPHAPMSIGQELACSVERCHARAGRIPPSMSKGITDPGSPVRNSQDASASEIPLGELFLWVQE